MGPNMCGLLWFVALLVHGVTSLECYDCKSKDPGQEKCLDGPFDSFKTTCDEDATGCLKMKITVLHFHEPIYERLPTNSSNPNAIGSDPPSVYKFREYKSWKNDDRIIRSCAKSRPELPYKQGCVFSTSLGGDIYVWTCYCPEEGCNGVDVIGASSMVLLFAAGWLLWLWMDKDGGIP